MRRSGAVMLQSKWSDWALGAVMAALTLVITVCLLSGPASAQSPTRTARPRRHATETATRPRRTATADPTETATADPTETATADPTAATADQCRDVPGRPSTVRDGRIWRGHGDRWRAAADACQRPGGPPRSPQVRRPIVRRQRRRATPHPDGDGHAAPTTTTPPRPRSHAAAAPFVGPDGSAVAPARRGPPGSYSATNDARSGACSIAAPRGVPARRRRCTRKRVQARPGCARRARALRLKRLERAFAPGVVLDDPRQLADRDRQATSGSASAAASRRCAPTVVSPRAARSRSPAGQHESRGRRRPGGDCAFGLSFIAGTQASSGSERHRRSRPRPRPPARRWRSPRPTTLPAIAAAPKPQPEPAKARKPEEEAEAEGQDEAEARSARRRRARPGAGGRDAGPGTGRDAPAPAATAAPPRRSTRRAEARAHADAGADSTTAASPTAATSRTATP